jgi:hypothetical protein
LIFTEYPLLSNSTSTATTPLTHTQTHCSQTPFIVLLYLSHRGFFGMSYLHFVASHLGYPSGVSEIFSSPHFHCLTFSFPHTLGLIRELNGDASLSTVHQDSLHEQIVTPSSCYDLSEFHQPPNTPAFLSEEYMVCTPPAVSGEYTNCRENKAPSGLPCSLPILFLSLLSVRQLSLSQALLLHLGFSQTPGVGFKHRCKVGQAACTFPGFMPHFSPWYTLANAVYGNSTDQGKETEWISQSVL